MNNAIVPKVYEIDYSFLIKNYLSPELWDKTWTLFVYRNIKVTLELDCINVRRPRKLTFKLTIIEDTYSTYKYISHDMTNSNFEVLRKQVNGSIRDLINYLEQHCIKKEDGYSRLCDSLAEERRRLEDIANSYLDDNGISLQDVRDAYVDSFKECIVIEAKVRKRRGKYEITKEMLEEKLEKGMKNKEIAEELGCEQSYISVLKKKFGLGMREYKKRGE